MGMRNSDATFLRREVLPILAKASDFGSPAAKEAFDRLSERLESFSNPKPVGMSLTRWHELPTGDDEPSAWRVTLMVDDCMVPYIDGVEYEDGAVHLTLDHRFGLSTSVDDLNDEWAGFLANAMAVSAGRTSHGEHSYIRNPHGRSGGGDPPQLVSSGASAETNASASIPSRGRFWMGPDHEAHVLAHVLDEPGSFVVIVAGAHHLDRIEEVLLAEAQPYLVPGRNGHSRMPLRLNFANGSRIIGLLAGSPGTVKGLSATAAWLAAGLTAETMIEAYNELSMQMRR